MGSVYLALMGSKASPRFCVIKQLGSTWADFGPDHMPEIRRRFQREAELTMELDHPAIPKTFSIREEKAPYLVQEFVDGINLKNLLPRLVAAGETFPIPLASHIIVGVARALGYLHDYESRGLVHRDVTPDNVMLTASGQVKLIDFGVAKATAVDDSLTHRGVVGKTSWLAPEIFRGAHLDRRADLYALGLLYWYLLTRQDPASSQSRREGSDEAFPPPSAFNPEVNAKLDRLVARATHSDPGLRFQTAEDMAEAASAHIPPDFAGKEEVAKLVLRITNRLGDNLLPRLLEEGRPLLDDAFTEEIPGVAGAAAPVGRRSAPVTPVVVPLAPQPEPAPVAPMALPAAARAPAPPARAPGPSIE